MTTSVISTWWGHPKKRLLLIGGASGCLVLLLGISAYAFGKEYLLDPAIQDTTQLIPREAVLFAEIRDPAQAIDLWQNSKAGVRLAALPAYQNLRATPQLQAFNNVSYLLELKTGLTTGNLIGSLNQPIGIALLQDDSYLFVSRTDLKSRLGIRLLESLKGKTIHLPNEDEFGKAPEAAANETNGDSDEADDPADIINRETSPPVLVERRTELSNLNITQIDLGDSSVFMVLLADVFFLSDSLKTLEKSLSLAGTPEARSLANIDGMQAARERFSRSGALALLYAATSSGSWAALPAVIGGDRGLIAVWNTIEQDGANPPIATEFDLFAAGASRIPGTAESNTPTTSRAIPVAFAKIAPRESILQIYSTNDTPAGLLEYFEDLDGAPEELAGQFEEFRKAAGLEIPDGNSASPGLSLTFSGFERVQQKLYPHVVVALAGDTHANLLAYSASVFGSPEENQELIFQNTEYTRMTRRGKRYEPTIVRLSETSVAADVGVSVLATRTTDIMATISASRGSRPTNSDHVSFLALQSHASAPIHIIVNLNEARLALREFLKFGADRNKAYSIRTINRDVMPLIDAFRDYGVLHLAAGSSGPEYGKIVITGQ